MNLYESEKLMSSRRHSTVSDIMDVCDNPGMRELLYKLTTNPKEYKLSIGGSQTLITLDRNLRNEIGQFKIAKIKQDNYAIQNLERRIDGLYVSDELTNIFYS
jgi:hypothetical protein